MNENLKRLLTFLVAASMVFSMLPMSVLADGTEDLDPEESVGTREPEFVGGATTPDETEPPTTEPENSEVQSFVVHPVSVIEGTLGFKSTNEQGQPYYHYSWDQAAVYEVTMADGTVYEGCKGFEHNGVYYGIGYLDDQDENHWEVGNTYNGTLQLLDQYGNQLKTAPATVTVTPSPVQAIVFYDLTLPKETFGSIYTNDDGSKSYFHYYWQEQLAWTIYYKDGTNQSGKGVWPEYNGQSYYIDHTDTQGYDTPWSAGTYEIEMAFMGKTAVATVQIVESLIKDISVAPVSFLPHTGGGINYDQQYFEYRWWENLEYTITFADDSTYTGTDRSFVYDGVEYWFYNEDDQSVTNQWQPGNTYTGYLSALGYTKEVSVAIQPSPVSQFTIQPITLYENTTGSIRTEQADPSSPPQSYFYYEWWQQANFNIVFQEGDPAQGTGSSFMYQGQWCHFHYNDGQSYANQWVAGNTYFVTVHVLGATVTVPVNIVADPIRDIVFEPVSIKEHTDGMWSDGPDGQYYFYTQWSNNLKYTVYFSDGTSQSGQGWGFYYQGQYYSFSTWTDQSFENPWLAGNTYYGTASVMGRNYRVPVNIYREANESGYTYMVQGEQAIITDCMLQDAQLQIPSTLGGYPVTGILSLGSAIEYATTVVIPDSVTMLSDNLFMPIYWDSTVALEHLVLGAGVTGIEMYMVSQAKLLTDITVSENNTAYCVVDGVLYTKDMSRLVIYPAAKTEKHIIPDSVTDIDVIFDNRDLYQNISFQMGAGVEGYVMEDGIIYNTEKTRIVMVTDAVTGDYVMPETVTAITSMAFANSKVTSVVVSKNVATITYGAFAGSKALETVTLPEGVGWISAYAFGGCSALKSVNFPSTVKAVYDSAYTGCTALESVSAASLENWMAIRFTSLESNPLCYGNDLYLDGQLVTQLEIPSVVRNVYDYAFVGSSITKLTVPGHVYSIGYSAFKNASIRELALSEGLDSISDSAFKETPVESVTLPDSLVRLGSEAFLGCHALENVHIGSGIRIIEWETFAETGLKSVTIPEQVEYIGYRAFANSKLEELELQCARVDIGEFAFENCPLKADLVLGENVSFYWGAFCGTDITQVKLPATITELTYRDFAYCENLVSVTISESVTDIWQYAFEDSDNLSHVLYTGTEEQWNQVYCESPEIFNAVIHFGTTGDEVTTQMTCNKILYTCSICNETVAVNRRQADHDFDEKGVCTICGHDSPWEYDVDEQTGFVTINSYSLTAEELVIPSEIKGMPVKAISPKAFAGRKDITSVVIPDSVTVLGAGAFKDCTRLESVTLSKNVSEIHEETFQNCRNLRSIDLSEGLSVIGNEAFRYCWNLEDMELPSTVTMIGYYAFECAAITELTVPASLKDIACGAFGGCVSLEKIWFLGDAMQMWDVFYGVWASVYYPAFNPTWQEFDREMLGGELQWFAKGLAPFVVQPQNVDSAVGGTLTVTAQAQGENLTYQWYCAAPGSTVFEKTEQTGTTFTMTVDGENSGSRVYCEVTDMMGQINRSKTVTLKITQEQTGIRVRRVPYTVEYAKNQQFRSSGLEVVKTYTDGSEVLTQDYTCSGYDPNVGGEQTITVTSGSYTATFTVTVIEEKISYTGTTATEEKIEISVPENAVETGAQLVVEKVELVEEEIPEVPEIIQQNQTVVFDISFQKEEQEVQPTEVVQVAIPVPENMESKRCKVYHVADDGQVQDMNAVYTDGHLVFETDHFSYYAVVEMEGVSISGKVTGENLFGVVVKLLSGDEVIETVEPLDGTYRFENVVDNDYVVEVEQEGEKTKRYNISVADMDKILNILLGILLGDIDGSDTVDVDDVIRLLLHVTMPEEFEIDAEADFDGVNGVDVGDVIRLLLYVTMPEEFPLEQV